MNLCSFLITFLVGLPVFAASAKNEVICPDVRLDQKGGAVERIPLGDQGDNEYCYAIVAAQMVDAYRFSHGDSNYKHQTSYLATAAFFSGKYREKIASIQGLTSKELAETDINFGDIDAAVATLKEKGSCSENDIYKDRASNSFGKLSGLKEILDEYRESLKSKDKHGAAKKQANLCNSLKSDFKNDFSEIYQQLMQSPNYYKYLDEVFTQACAGHSISLQGLPPFVMVPTFKRTTPAENTSLLKKKVSEVFSKKNPQPISVNFCAEVLAGLRPARDCKGHTAMIIGSRPGGGGCELLVRNSDGAVCKYKNDFHCDRGQYWIPASTLAPTVSKISYFAEAEISPTMVPDMATDLAK